MSYDWDKIRCIRKQKADKQKRLNTEKDYDTKRKLQIEIKILELKEMIERIK